MADLRGFDANKVEPNNPLDPLPSGKYPAVITESEMKPNKAGTGSYLQLTFEVLDGNYKGRKLWSRLNLDHPNSQATQIAKAELSAICRSVGVMAPGDSTDLHDLPLTVHVKLAKRADTGELANEVKGYSKKDVPSPAAPSSTPPWKR